MRRSQGAKGLILAKVTGKLDIKRGVPRDGTRTTGCETATDAQGGIRNVAELSELVITNAS